MSIRKLIVPNIKLSFSNNLLWKYQSFSEYFGEGRDRSKVNQLFHHYRYHDDIKSLEANNSYLVNPRVLSREVCNTYNQYIMPIHTQQSGPTSLMLAAGSNDVDMMKVLLMMDAKIDERDEHGQ